MGVKKSNYEAIVVIQNETMLVGCGYSVTHSSEVVWKESDRFDDLILERNLGIDWIYVMSEKVEESRILA